MMHYQQNLSLSNDFRHFCALAVLNNRCLVGVTAITCYFTEVSAETFSGSLHLLPLASMLDPLWLPMKSWCVWLNRKRVIGQHFLFFPVVGLQPHLLIPTVSVLAKDSFGFKEKIAGTYFRVKIVAFLCKGPFCRKKLENIKVWQGPAGRGEDQIGKMGGILLAIF